MELAYRKYGEGQPFLILHGLFGQSDNWNSLAKRFATEGFEVFAIDLRNHGLSPHHEIWNYDVMADDLFQFIQTHQLKKPILSGHSLGGKVSMNFELKNPGYVEKLIISDIAPRAYEPKHSDVLEALNSVDFTKAKSRKEVEETLQNFIEDYGTRQFLLKNLYWEKEDQLNWRFNLKVISANYNEVSIEMPKSRSEADTLVLRGALSDYVLESDKEEFTIRFPNHSITTIPNSGHWIHAEQPEAYFSEVMRFIRQ